MSAFKAFVNKLYQEGFYTTSMGNIKNCNIYNIYLYTYILKFFSFIIKSF